MWTVAPAAAWELLKYSCNYSCTSDPEAVLQAYPEFARTTFDQAPPGFSSACSELSKKHGKVTQHTAPGQGLLRLLQLRAVLHCKILGLQRVQQLTGMCGTCFRCSAWRSRLQGVSHLLGCHCLQAADRRYILLYIWMARQGAGAVNPKLIMSSAKRLRVT